MKVCSLVEVIQFSNESKRQGMTVGLVVGCFDVLHLGHINLFRFAKQHADTLIVGLDHDTTVRLTKGSTRPINSFERRSAFLNDITTVDKIFLIQEIFKHGTKKAKAVYKSILEQIQPTYIFTHQACDDYWEDREKMAKQVGTICILDTGTRITNSSEILRKLKL